MKETIMGHHENGDWIDITNIPDANLRLMEFDSVVYTEKLSRQEIKSMYPELYKQKFTPSSK